MKIGLIGIGVMGEPMARNLHGAGFKVTVYNRTAARCEPLRAPDGVVNARVEGKTVILMATVAPAHSSALGRAIAAAGAHYVEAPVSGSRKPAETGQLVILASAENERDIDAVEPVFAALGKKTVRCGAVPAAMRMKLANNLLLIASFEALSEATNFAQTIGLDMTLFFDMVLAGPLANDVLRMKAPKLLTGDFAEQAPIRNVAKDIGLVCDEADQRGAWLPVAEANRTLCRQAMQRGQASDDAIGIIKVLRTGGLA